MREHAKLPTVYNVTPGGEFTLECPVRPTYEKITLKLTNITPAQLTALEIRVDGRPVQRFKDAVRVNAINNYYKRGVTGGYVDFHFTRPEMASVFEQRMTALGTADIKTLTIVGKIDAACVSPAVEAYAIRSEPQPIGLITKIREFPMSFAVSGQVDIDKIPLSRAALAAIHLFKSDVSACTVEANNAKIYERPKEAGEHDQSGRNRTPQNAACTHLDFMLEGSIREALTTEGIQDFRLRPTIASSGSLDVVVEYLDGIGGL